MLLIPKNEQKLQFEDKQTFMPGGQRINCISAFLKAIKPQTVQKEKVSASAYPSFRHAAKIRGENLHFGDTKNVLENVRSTMKEAHNYSNNGNPPKKDADPEGHKEYHNKMIRAKQGILDARKKTMPRDLPKVAQGQRVGTITGASAHIHLMRQYRSEYESKQADKTVKPGEHHFYNSVAKPDRHLMKEIESHKKELSGKQGGGGNIRGRSGAGFSWG